MFPIPPSCARTALFAVALVSALAAGPQDPKPATPAPPAEAVTPHPFEGVYQLRRRVVAGVIDNQPSTGYLAITRRHLFIQLAAPGPDPDLPLLRAGVRTWAAKDGALQTTVRIGFYTDADGNVLLEKPDTVELRRLELLRGGVRVRVDEHNYLDFERVE